MLAIGGLEYKAYEIECAVLMSKTGGPVPTGLYSKLFMCTSI